MGVKVPNFVQLRASLRILSLTTQAKSAYRPSGPMAPLDLESVKKGAR